VGRKWYIISVGMHYKQYVSHEAALRDDVKTLKESAVDEILRKRAAKQTGICSVRENIHMQLLDEVIRQITIDCVERGLLLHRVKEQGKMLLSSYQTLYHRY
jgi:dynein light intermediate chain, axonemal